MQAYVYKSQRKADTFVYLAARDDFERIPDSLRAPLGELAGYQSRLNALTGGQGRYTIELSHYEAVPPNLQTQLVSQHQVKDEE